MDNKRKAGGSKNGDRDLKRRKTESAHTPEYDLNQGESRESTTAYGLTFLRMLRSTQDKSGRKVAGYFEKLPIKSKNESYYKKIQMPISLKMVERHLNQGDFQDLAELESYVKRMVTNAKEFHNKNSQEYEDAERIRKAASNYMTKHNPAYKKVASYTAQATPLASKPEAECLEELAAQGSASADDDSTGNQDDDDGEEAAEAEGDGDDDDDDDGGDDDDDGDDDEEDEDDDDEDEDDDDEDQPPRRSRSGRIVINVNKAQPAKSSKWLYEDVPYQSLPFQKAQEKILEELIRREDEDGDAIFVNFINLPSRQFKEYYNVISNPISLTGLQKQVVGKKGRLPPTGKTEFGTWNSFEEKASLLWENAHYFNEEGSDVYEEASRLKEQFYIEFKQAKAAVPEPTQAKIKLKVAGQDAPGARKVSINVGSASASPAPPTGRSVESQPAENAMNGTPARNLRTVSGPVMHPAVSQARSMSGSVASPSPAPNAPAEARQSPAFAPVPNGTPGAVQNGHPPAAQPLQNGFHQAPTRRNPMVWEEELRAPGKGLANALIERLTIRSRSGKPDDRFKFVIQASPQLAQQNIAVHVPAGHHHLQLVAQLAPLEHQRRQYRLFVQWQDKTLPRSMPTQSPDDPLPPNALVFDTQLQPGGNRLAVSVIAALPKGEKLSGGEESEVERFVILAHLASH